MMQWLTCLKYLSLLNEEVRKSSYRSFKSSRFWTYEIAFCPTPPTVTGFPPVNISIKTEWCNHIKGRENASYQRKVNHDIPVPLDGPAIGLPSASTIFPLDELAAETSALPCARKCWLTQSAIVRWPSDTRPNNLYLQWWWLSLIRESMNKFIVIV